MKIQGLKIANITILFSASLNHVAVTQQEVFNLFKLDDPQMDLFNFIEAAGLKVMTFPSQKKDIAFENNRLLLNDKTEKKIDESPLVTDLKKILDKGLVDSSKIAAYGFNYDVLVESSNTFKNLIGEKILKLPDIDIQNAGAFFNFSENNVSYSINIMPTGNEKVFTVHFNSHFNSNLIPQVDEMKKQLIDQFKKLENILNSI